MRVLRCSHARSGPRLAVAVAMAASLLVLEAPAQANRSGKTAAQKRAADRPAADSARTRSRPADSSTRPDARSRQRFSVSRAFRRLVGQPKRQAPQLTRAEEGVVRALSARLAKQHDGRIYEPVSFQRLDARGDNPFMGADNFLEVTLENQRTSKKLPARVLSALDSRSKRRVLIKINDTEALGAIGKAKDGSQQEAEAIEKAIERGAFEVLDESSATGLSRLMQRIGGRRGLRQLMGDIRSSRRVRGRRGSNLLAGGALAGLPLAPGIGKLALLYIVLQRGHRAIQGVMGMRKRRRTAFEVYSRTLQEHYVTNGTELVRRDGETPLKLGSDGNIRLPKRLTNVEDVFDLYSSYVDLLNQPGADNALGRSEVEGREPPVIGAFDKVDFVHRFKDVGFDPAPGS